MTPPTSLVPSKNALRALRHLALSNPSILVGTVGSICGIAALNYETCRRVRVAERIVETKRVLRSVSSGRGAAHLDALFEAAERGDDFTLGSRGGSRRSRRRKGPGEQYRDMSTAASVPRDLDSADSSSSLARAVGGVEHDDAGPAGGRRVGGRESDLQVGESQVVEDTSTASQRRTRLRFRKIFMSGDDGKRHNISPQHSISTRRAEEQTIPSGQHEAESLPGCVEKWLSQGPAEHEGTSSTAWRSAGSSSAAELDRGHSHTDNMLKTDSVNTSSVLEGISSSQHSQSSDTAPARDSSDIRRDHPRRSPPHLSGSHSSDTSGTAVPQIEDNNPDSWTVPIKKIPSGGSSHLQAHLHSSSPGSVPPNKGQLSGASVHRAGASKHRNPRPSDAAQNAHNSPKAQGHGLQWTPLLFSSRSGFETQSPLGDGVDPAWPDDIDLKELTRTQSAGFEGQLGDFSIPHHLIMGEADEVVEQALKEHLLRANGTASSKPSSSSTSPMVGHATHTITPEILSHLVAFIRPPTGQLSKPIQYRRFAAVMRHLVEADPEPDWFTAEAVFHAGRGLFDVDEIFCRPVYDLLRHMLSTETSYARAQEILFGNVSGRYHVTDATYELGAKYLSLFCQLNQDYSIRVAEMAKLIKLAKERGLERSENLAMPVLRAVVFQGDTEAARTLIDELQLSFEGRSLRRLWGEYAVWNAAQGNWEEAQWILDRMQETGYSRHQPEQYAAVFHRMLVQYLSKNTAHRAFGFTINAIKYTGLIPTGRISRTVVCACIREHRYDLVFEWTRLVTEAFPRLTSGFMTAQGAWQLAHALQEAGASCRDITDTCRAIAHGCYDDPFPHYLRPLLADLVKLDLSHRLEAASALDSQALFSADGVPLMTMNQLLQEARRFCATESQIGAPMDQDRLKQDLAMQLDAVEELTRVFRGDVFMADLPYEVVEGEEPITSEGTPTADNQSRRPPRLSPSSSLSGKTKSSPAMINSAFADVLTQHKSPPRYEDVSTAVMNHYATRAKQGLGIDHSLLKHVVDRFAPQNPMDALTLIEEVYDSDYVQGMHGVPFDNDFFVKWLQIVTTVGSVKAASTALWAVVDSARHIQWTLDFSFCLNIVTCICLGGSGAGAEMVVKTDNTSKGMQWHHHKNKNRYSSNESKMLTPEMFYLGRRLWWTRLRSPHYVHDTFEFPKWRPWELALREAAAKYHASPTKAAS
ncbi:hypothetical protein HRR83_002558 [Exophiala dermatitidis]|uniref:Pentatricopeptide repeat protein n=2 Tax=Exophiala dermatitidis TaxID=5970 RepID=H6BZJ8_EXODN|nr:uncharacterized protein HMPREF1120_05111 [Exophiala dermatitidis NIH/UT8656]KAJ4514471.1 hypothetical protein HRR73_005499 [Exophiala dermatitidis]EHY57061.1 hypothetical protein HMPREF1120_05111 [Exophiala dermatitidis NIH/UT8656]KAJ4523762.1 hypothetical protein HRR74_001955 [Exophiala dermatitidis]KAJ4537301.1 hypothetical protein HRR76_005312 [Exophiala dermatitidis]KAJ4555103.1 hypothetical protein HRR77_001046 [Exophiala dermatitidis]